MHRISESYRQISPPPKNVQYIKKTKPQTQQYLI